VFQSFFYFLISCCALLSFVNGYLPVVALLGLILLLPVVFEYLAVKYEGRKTYSDVQASMLSRYFYYQLANIYVSVSYRTIDRVLVDVVLIARYLLLTFPLPCR
jgi:Calcium-dependent channel, 7TM region, putative phosphate